MKQSIFRIVDEKVYFSDSSFFELMGIDEKTVQGSNYFDTLSKYLNEEMAKYFSELIQDKENAKYNRIFVNDKNGSILPLSIFGQVIRTLDSQVVLGTIIETRALNQELFGTLDDLTLMQHAFNSSIILAITDTVGRITYANSQFCEISGYESHELIGRTHKIVNSGYHPPEFFKEMWETIQSGETWRGEVKNRKKDGTYYWADSTIIPVLNEDGEPFQYMAIRYNITNQKENEAQILHLANRDSLTGVANRRLFDEHLVASIEQAKKKSEKFGVLFIDLDSFKYVNDTKGHAVGDELLIQVSNRLSEIIGNNGLVARIGGDEFSMIIYNVASLEELKQTAEELLLRFKEPFFIDDFILRMTCSIGIAIFPESGTNTEMIMKNADSAMYQVKNTRKNDYLFSINHVGQSNQRLFHIQNNLRASNFDEEFYLVYQPKVNPYTNQVTGLEALLRWRHHELGEVSPGEFIPIAEEIGMLNDLNDWVLEHACKQIRQWMAQNYPVLPVSINLSASKFVQTNFVEKFLAILKAYEVATEWIHIEITEGVLIYSEVQAQEILKTLRAHGIQIALDDFGTGYSSLSYLIKLDLDTLKIDKSLIQGISENCKERKVVGTIIQLGKDLGLRVVAEGVEELNELQVLIDYGVDEVQGYYYSRPKLPEEIKYVFNKAIIERV